MFIHADLPLPATCCLLFQCGAQPAPVFSAILPPTYSSAVSCLSLDVKWMQLVHMGCRERVRASWCSSPVSLAPSVPCVLLMPFSPSFPQWLKDPGPRNEKRTLFCDMVCFLFITPLAAISGWLCLRGAQDHLQFNSRLEAIGLIALTIALFTIYVLWTLVSFRYHCQLYSEWRRTNQKVRLMIPASRSPHPVPHSLLSAKLLKKTSQMAEHARLQGHFAITKYRTWKISHIYIYIYI
uniref:RING-type E3 ubiquitin transferase n=1 Tax=Cairina moschata TaxID=8855 RepID=A0A8C3BIN9_CAIMO